MGASGRLLWVLALTSIHPGVGRSEEAHVDLPVQRDEFGLPAIWASSLKGAVRDKAEGSLFDGSKCAAVSKRGECAKAIVAFGLKPDYARGHSPAVPFLHPQTFTGPAPSLLGCGI